ncbi:5-oxoprolinase/urea amidolyase family protein [Pseudonocardia abyssalis]|uniref:5-oxoprolinase/urea amidolyase family protein n=1 Tax=Pseudonocardia abyssalis TaxID=2792008 RepID=A0ABS6UYM1_9PSEU|nr:5-oxoprolinase/urea amidolyase family protein [Pseudonocardia abyssalis]
MRVLACGDSALLCEVADLDAVLALAAAVRAAAFPAVLDVVPAARTVLLLTAPGTDLGTLRRAVLALPVDPSAAAPDGETVEIPVVYDGPDLDEVGRLTGLGAEGVVEAHTATPWRVGFGGFAPGFAYLAGGDGRLHVPRRDEPRTTVPAGSVGLAGEFSGIYPRASPGGWQLIGSTTVQLWDAHRTPAALLRPGAEVRFVRTSEPQRAPQGGRNSSTAPKCAARRMLEVLATGALALVQDLGRPGAGATGVGRSGAADRAALRLGNRLVANPPSAAAVEVVFGGLAVRAGPDLPAPLLLALTGAPAPADVDGTPVGHHALVTLRAGQTLRLGAPPTGLRTYLAVRGGVEVAAVLGSRSTDVLSGVGPAPLAAGDLLPVGPEPADLPRVDVAPVAVPPGDAVTLRAVPGPRADWVADPAALAATTWTASGRSDRVGMRLEGAPLRRRDHGELPSEGMVRGAVQVPPGGEPVLFGADHPVTGGYPVVAVVLDADMDRAAQIRPGQQVRFRLLEEPR